MADYKVDVHNLGQISYVDAYRVQEQTVQEVLQARADARAGGSHTQSSSLGKILVVEHVPAVITISRRPGAGEHLLASKEVLAQQGIEVQETDRGGDITYHGPGQLVLYPIVDLEKCGIGLHGYMRLLEEAVIMFCAKVGCTAQRDTSATGVWIGDSKVCAMGVRIRKWVTMHGLAVNITTNLEHFNYIVPCGLAGRSVTSLERVLGSSCPTFADTTHNICKNIIELLITSAQSRDVSRGMI